MREITVVVPNYNGMKYLPGCLLALENQESGTPDFTVLVVDNGSTDGSVEYLQGLPLQSLLLPENTGFCHAVNVGIQAAETPYVILLNNDTKVDAGFVKALYEAIDGKEEVFSVSSSMRMWDKPEWMDDAGDQYSVLGWAFARGKGKPATDYNTPCEVFSACGGAAIYRKEVFDKIGMFDELHFAYLEDLDMGYRARIHGYRNLYEPGAVVCHFGSASTGSRYNERKTELASANSVYVIGKNMPLLQWLWNLPFLLLGFLIKTCFFAAKGMGKTYLTGLWRGFLRCLSEEGCKKHVPFCWKNWKNYLYIQWRLYVNTIGILMKS